jgi:hypothetical protein
MIQKRSSTHRSYDRLSAQLGYPPVKDRQIRPDQSGIDGFIDIKPKESRYTFRGLERLLADFWRDVNKRR